MSAGLRHEGAARAGAVPLLGPSGSTWSYSGPGFLIAAWIIERIVDTTYKRSSQTGYSTPPG
jgi:CubicO group peptidase (beta-lactamase class C family)